MVVAQYERFREGGRARCKQGANKAVYLSSGEVSFQEVKSESRSAMCFHMIAFPAASARALDQVPLRMSRCSRLQYRGANQTDAASAVIDVSRR